MCFALPIALLAFLASISSISAHIALWDKGMFGLNYPDQVDANKTNWNNNLPVNPLRESDGLTVSQWFGHGYKGYPPRSGDFMILPAGGRYSGDVHCNRYGTRQRNPTITEPLPQYACNTVGQLHVMNVFGQPVDNSKFGGTALAIAYTSDVNSLRPNDMTVISVNYNSVWEREIGYDIPANLPPCPEGGCLCTWNWIHQSSELEGYANEIYNILYRCQVIGSSNVAGMVQRGQVPRECGSNPSDCIKGPKTPMYVYQAEGNNIPRLYRPPLYRSNWGFSDGAQNDIFEAGASAAPTTYLDNAYATGTATTRTTPAASATALPTGWSEIGCMVDDPNSRALDGGVTQMSNLTIEACVASCSSRGFNYAGVEYGEQCFCGNKLISNAAPATECNVRCKGDQWSFCGGSYRINVYRAPSAPTTFSPAITGTASQIAPTAIPSGWTSLGCHVDSPSSRALNGGSTFSNKMTVATCITICANKAMPYAGLEYGSECFCGNNATFNPAADGCTSRCSGDPYVLCGGSYRINIFRGDPVLASSISSPPSTSSETTASRPLTSDTSVAKVSSSKASPSMYSPSSSSSGTSNTFPVSNLSSSLSTAISQTKMSPTTTLSLATSSPKPSPTTSSSSKPSIGTTIVKSSSGTVRSSTSSSRSPAAPSISLPSGWRSLGCVVDVSSKRVLNGSYSESTSQTPSVCMTSCRTQGFKYAGLEYGRQCYCGNNVTGASTVATGCTSLCTGDKSLNCGGNFRMNLYAFTTSSVSRRDLVAKTSTGIHTSSIKSENHEHFSGRMYPPPMRPNRF